MPACFAGETGRLAGRSKMPREWRVNIYEERVIRVREGDARGGGPANLGQKARSYALRLLAMGDRTVKELESKLRRKGFPEDIVGEVLAEMMSSGYLDDEKLAARFAENSAESWGIGPYRIRAELSRRGVPGSVIEQALRRAFEGEREGEVALALARTWLERHGMSLGRDEGVARRRLYGFLARRGFSSEVIERALREVLG